VRRAEVLSVLSRASAVVGVTIIELSEEHGSLPGGAEGGPTPPSAITLAGESRHDAVQFSSAVLIFIHIGRRWAGGGSAAPVLAGPRGPTSLGLRRVGLQQQLGLGNGTGSSAASGDCPLRPKRGRLRRAFNDFRCLASRALRQHALNGLDRRLYLLVAHRLDAAGMLDSHVPRDQKHEQFQEDSRLLLHHFVDCRAPAPAKGGVHLPDGV